MDLIREERDMAVPLTAEDLWPLVQKLGHAEQVRLAKLAMVAASRSGRDSEAYRILPPGPDEFRCEEDNLAWDAAGWEDLDESR